MSIIDTAASLENAIIAAFHAEAGSIIEQAIGAAKAKLEADLRSATGGIAARVFSDWRFERNGPELVIRVKIEGIGA